MAKWMGFDFKPESEPQAFFGEIEPGDGPSILDLNAMITPPIPGGETLAASFQAMKLLHAPEGSA